VEVAVNLYGELRKYLQPNQQPTFVLGVPAGMAVNDVLGHLKVPPELPVAVVVNGVHRHREWRLQDHDVLSLFGLGAFAETLPL